MTVQHFAASLFVLFAAVGCGNATDKHKEARPKTAPAGGVVTYNGQPLSGAKVILAPTAKGVAASAMTDADGEFILMAYPPDPGVVPGSYTVTVTKIEAPPDVQHTETSHDEAPPKAAKPKSLIPEKYGDAKKSGLTLEVPDGGKEDIKLELKD